MRSLLVAAALLLAGCAGPQMQYTFFADVPPEHYESVRQAVEEWQSCGVVDITIVRDDAVGAIPIQQVSWPIEGPPDCPCDGYTAPDSKYIHYTTNEDVRVTIGHELGHALGLAHAAGNRIMNPEYVYAQASNAHVTDLDCEALRSR